MSSGTVSVLVTLWPLTLRARSAGRVQYRPARTVCDMSPEAGWPGACLPGMGQPFSGSVLGVPLPHANFSYRVIAFA